MAKIRSITYRSVKAWSYRSLYSTKHWTTLRRQAVTCEDYQCQHSGCGAQLQPGRVHPLSAVVYDLMSHEGDLKLFFDLKTYKQFASAVTQTRSNRKRRGDKTRLMELMDSRLINITRWPFNINFKEQFIIFEVLHH